MPNDVSPLAGKPVEPSMLVNVARLVTVYFAGKPDRLIAKPPRAGFGAAAIGGRRTFI